MSYANPHTFLLEISPQRSFLENWGKFKEIKKLYVPISFGADLAADPKNQQEVLEFIDVASAYFTDDMRVGFVYTDPGISTSNSLLAEIDSVVALKRFFKNKNIQGLTFNPPMANDTSRLAFTAYRSILPRLIGFLSTEIPSSNLAANCNKAAELLRGNRVYEALHLAAHAREEGFDIEQCLYTELEALFSLGLLGEALQLLEWYKDETTDIRFHIFEIRFKSLSGFALESIQLLQQLSLQVPDSHLVWLELGRALIMQNRPKEAIEAFERSLSLSRNCDALLGQAIALRAIHFGQRNRAGLLKSLDYFNQLIALDGYYKAEALHHAGTIYSALEEWEHAIECYKRTLEIDPSPVSKLNLSLALIAIGETDAALTEYNYLTQYYPTYGKSLDKYFEENELVFIAEENTNDSQQIHTALTDEKLSHLANESRQRLKKWRITMKNDLLDFRRVDDYINYHAPAGVFLESSKLHHLTEHQYRLAVLDIALHLGAILVESNLAEWQIEPHFTPIQVGLVIKDGSENYLPLSLFSNVARRIEAGGSDSSLVSLDALVNALPDYRAIASEYSNPFTTLPADEDRVEEFQSRALNAHTALSQLGFSLTGTISDIRELELAISSTWKSSGGLAELASRGVLNYELIDDIGFYFGTLFETLAGGEWHEHDDLNGISLQSMVIKNIHPVLEIRKRFEIGAEATEMTSLLAFEPPLVCANLSIQMQENLISTREELIKLITEHLPTIVDEDPTGNSINRMADMITAFAAIKTD